MKINEAFFYLRVPMMIITYSSKDITIERIKRLLFLIMKSKLRLMTIRIFKAIKQFMIEKIILLNWRET